MTKLGYSDGNIFAKTIYYSIKNLITIMTRIYRRYISRDRVSTYIIQLFILFFFPEPTL